MVANHISSEQSLNDILCFVFYLSGRTPTSSSTTVSLAGSSSSSGGEESQHQQQQTLYRRRRRRHRRRTLSSQEEEESQLVRRKTARIETALLNCDRDRLAQLAVSPGGLLSDEVIARIKYRYKLRLS